jgi:hypothetical protein
VGSRVLAEGAHCPALFDLGLLIRCTHPLGNKKIPGSSALGGREWSALKRHVSEGQPFMQATPAPRPRGLGFVTL